ncbi:hypothetical protein [Flavobacterium ajazii]|uniref:hypothetical protein n=1 Tax=Flavobacterium ajazii TaxID=2692318 RepID=UPI0013D112A1|nr:hypothetical protein [Flavobacterium ajazii]
MTILFFSIVVTVSAQDNSYPNLCPHSATNSKSGGLKAFWESNKTKVKINGKKVCSQNSDCNALLTLTTPDKPIVLGFDYIFVKSEKVPAMDNNGMLHYNKPFDATYLLRYKSDKEPLQKTWWFHKNNNPKKEIISYNESLSDIYKKELDFRLTLREDLESELSSQKFVFTEYVGMLKNKNDLCFTNTLFVKSGLITDVADYEVLVKFFNGFLKKFQNSKIIEIEHRVFLVTVKGKTNKYVIAFKVVNSKLQGELELFNSTTKQTVLTSIENSFSTLLSEGAAYFYGDDLFGLGKSITEIAAKKNILLITRSTSIDKTFEQTETALLKLKDKKIDKNSVSFLNGTPNTNEEATFQSFEGVDLELLQKLRSEINAKAAEKSSTTITTKEQLITELRNGANDVIFIVAHCDEKNIYFGSSKISIEELSNLSKRTNREKERVAFLFSCLTGNLFDKRKPFLPFFNKKIQSFSEVLIEKNFFDLIVSPPNTINGDDVLKMIDELDKHSILELRQRFNELLQNREFYNIAQR